MFSNGFPKEWSTLRKLAWLYRTVINAVVSVLKTIIGNPIHITDALAKPVQALSIALEPIQDLHGYDNPWPAGGGKNKININGSVVSEARNPTDAYPVEQGSVIKGFSKDGYQRPNNATATVNGNDVTVTISQSSYGYGYVCAVTAGETYTFSHADINWVGLTWLDADKVFLSFESNVAGNITKTAPNGAAYAVFILLPSTTGTPTTYKNAMVEKGSTATSYAPYSNICPISGHTDADVVRDGKNLLKPQMTQGASSTVIFGQSDTTSFGTFLKAGTYTVSVQSSKSFAFYYRAENGTENVHIGGYNVTSATFTLTDDLRIRLYAYLSAGLSVSDISNPQLELGSTATDYEPYVGTTYPIPLGQTVYGGTLDVTTGKLTVDRAMVDMGSMVWTYNTTYAFFASTISTRKIGVLNLWSDIFKTMAGSWTGTPVQNALWGNGSNATIYVQYPITEVSEFLSLVSGHQLCYELATPIEITLTPTEVTLLLGENNLWSDSNGDLTLTYLADGNASEIEALNILLGGRYVNNHEADEPSDREALNIILGGNER